MDILSSPIVVLILALLAIPAVTSALTGGIRKLSAASGIPPQAIVYVASAIITGLVILATGTTLPGWSGDPAGYVAAWLVWAGANTALTRALYDVLWGRFFNQPETPAW